MVAKERICEIPDSVKLDRPMDFVRPAVYTFSIARQVGSGLEVKALLMMYWVES